MSFYNFLIKCLHKMLIIAKKGHNERYIAYLYDLFFVITELLVEIIQGNEKEILTKGNLMQLKII